LGNYEYKKIFLNISQKSVLFYLDLELLCAVTQKSTYSIGERMIERISVFTPAPLKSHQLLEFLHLILLQIYLNTPKYLSPKYSIWSPNDHMRWCLASSLNWIFLVTYLINNLKNLKVLQNGLSHNPSSMSGLYFSFCFWDEISLCSPDWPLVPPVSLSE
jgi:hypothetical protein